MKKFWSENAYEYYKAASLYYNYPEVPFGSFFRKIIGKEDVVADIGCGFGITSLYLAQMSRKVFAIDQDSYALEKVEAAMKMQGVDNVVPICAQWPKLPVEEWDVAVGIYHHHFANTADRIDALVKKTKKAGIISVQAPRERESFHKELEDRLGLKPRRTKVCENGCYVRGRLEQAGLKVECVIVPHDFGQPVKTMEEAISFMQDQMKVGDKCRQTIADFAKEYVEEIDGGYLLPIRRYNCVITFEK